MFQIFTLNSGHTINQMTHHNEKSANRMNENNIFCNFCINFTSIKLINIPVFMLLVSFAVHDV